MASTKADTIKVLTVGDGNFSFSLNYLRQQEELGNQIELTATSFDSYDDLVSKYPESMNICASLQSAGARVVHNIDATNLQDDLFKAIDASECFDTIIFNHPHCGEENVQRHQMLLSHFFASTKPLLCSKGSEVRISLAEDQKDRWGAEKCAARVHFHLTRVISDVDEDATYGVEYDRKRHQNGKSFHQVTLHGEKKRQKSDLLIFQLSDNKPVVQGPVVTKKRRRSDDQSTAFHCEACDKSFSTAQGYRTHVHMVHELQVDGTTSSSKRLPCSSCDKTFKNEEARRQHQVAKHGSDTNIQPDWKQTGSTESSDRKDDVECDICGFYFTKDTLDTHLGQLQPLQPKKKVCSCGKAFDQDRALRQHQNFCQADA